MPEIKIFPCDFSNSQDIQAVCDLMNAYIIDKMGNGKPLGTSEQKELIKGLAEHPTALVLLAKVDNTYAGLTNCFINFGTFAVKKFINIHDIIVETKYRGTGVGRKLMQAIIEKANELDCAKVTLEVRKDNIVAQNLYQSMGFDECAPPMHFWSKYL